jgi:hypothetical protein
MDGRTEVEDDKSQSGATIIGEQKEGRRRRRMMLSREERERERERDRERERR